MVSDEDRELARVEAATALVHKRWDRYAFKDTDEKVALKALDVIELSDSPWMHAMIDALVENAYWGPRPTVTRDALVDHVARLEVPRVPVVAGVLNISAESMADALVPFLRECGIEVTDDRPE